MFTVICAALISPVIADIARREIEAGKPGAMQPHRNFPGAVVADVRGGNGECGEVWKAREGLREAAGVDGASVDGEPADARAQGAQAARELMHFYDQRPEEGPNL